MKQITTLIGELKNRFRGQEAKDTILRTAMQDIVPEIFGGAIVLADIKEYSTKNNILHVRLHNKAFAQEFFLRRNQVCEELHKRGLAHIETIRVY